MAAEMWWLSLSLLVSSLVHIIIWRCLHFVVPSFLIDLRCWEVGGGVLGGGGADVTGNLFGNRVLRNIVSHGRGPCNALHCVVLQ